MLTWQPQKRFFMRTLRFNKIIKFYRILGKWSLHFCTSLNLPNKFRFTCYSPSQFWLGLEQENWAWWAASTDTYPLEVQPTYSEHFWRGKFNFYCDTVIITQTINSLVYAIDNRKYQKKVRYTSKRRCGGDQQTVSFVSIATLIHSLVLLINFIDNKQVVNSFVFW